MNKRRLDVILCNWPLLGFLIIPLAILTSNFQNKPLLETLVAVLFGGGWFLALAYGFYRLIQQQWATKKVVLWVLGLLWFSLFSLPWLYWKHLRKEIAQQ